MFNEIDSCFARWVAWMIIGFIIISVITALLGAVEDAINTLSDFLENIWNQIAQIPQKIIDFFRAPFKPGNSEKTPSPDETTPPTLIAEKPTTTPTCDGSRCKSLTYTVRSGDTLAKIAQEFNTSWPEIVDENRDNCPSLQGTPGFLEVGWVLCLPSTSEGGPSPVPTPGPTPSSPVHDGYDSMEKYMLDLLNNYRKEQAKCEPLVHDPDLQEAAEDWAFSTPCSAVKCHTGYPHKMIPEIMADVSSYAGHEGADEALNWWKTSPDHRNVILNCSLTRVGIGHASTDSRKVDCRKHDNTIGWCSDWAWVVQFGK